MRLPQWMVKTPDRKTIAISGAVGLAIYVAMVFFPNNLAVQLSTLIFGLQLALWALIGVDRHLRERGKNLWWLLLFFGPFVVQIFVLESVVKTEKHNLIIMTFIFGALLTAPTAIWGMVVLTAKPKTPPAAD